MTDARTEEIIARALWDHDHCWTKRKWESAISDEKEVRYSRAAAIIASLQEEGKVIVDVERQRWKHVKRGSFYRVLGQGNAQVSSHIKDLEPVIIYQAEEGGSLWVRPATEFYDGRFVLLQAEKGDTRPSKENDNG